MSGAPPSPALDLIAIGRASVDLYGQQIGGRLEDMASFAKYVGGSPANTAIGAARLGLEAALLTRVGADHMGRFLLEQLGRDGVDTRRIVSDPDRLTALAILGIRDTETFPLLFYRENCADMALCPADVDPAWIATAKAILVNGTHLSRPGPAAAVQTAIDAAKRAGRRVVFDIDYRPVLWDRAPRDRGEDRFVADDDISDRLADILADCDLIVGTEDEFRILGGAIDLVEALRSVRARTTALLVLKRGPDGCVAFPDAIPDDLEAGLVVPGFPVTVLNVLGAGDAFMAGFLRGWLCDEPIATCCRWGNAAGALVVTRHGCAPAMPGRAELDHLLAGAEVAGLTDLHWAANRGDTPETLMVLAVDHRPWFDDLADATGAGPDAIARFKQLAVAAVDRVAAGKAGYGLLLDGRHGAAGLAHAADLPYWIGRPIELPRSRPLAFDSSPDVATELLSWPTRQVVKCLVTYHPDDPAALRCEQEAQLTRLADACRKTGHELLIEIIVPGDPTSDLTVTARAIRQFYAAGIRPDWWKLEPATDPGAWTAIGAAIAEGDPLCRGAIVLGLSCEEATLLAAFAAAAPCPLVRGFAVGRTIFGSVAQDWFAGRIDDSEAIRDMAARFQHLGQAWQRLKAEAGTA